MINQIFVIEEFNHIYVIAEFYIFDEFHHSENKTLAEATRSILIDLLILSIVLDYSHRTAHFNQCEPTLEKLIFWI